MRSLNTFPSLIRWLALFLVFCAGVFAVFYKLGAPPVYMWDEARYANNSIDMYTSHDYMVVSMEGKPDLYNTKPPLVLWMQTLSMKVFGVNEFALRFPSALAAVLIMLMMMWFSISVLGSYSIGTYSILILVCMVAFNGPHGARSGDLDGILTFWMTMYSLTYLRYLQSPERRSLFLVLTAFGITGAFLSKGIMGFFMLPALFLITVLSKNFIPLARRWQTWALGIVVLLVFAGYYALREHLSPGYWSTVTHSELMRFQHAVMSWHVQPFDFYFKALVKDRFTPFIYVLPFSLIVWVYASSEVIKKSYRCLLIIAVTFFLLISYPAVKLPWYDEPLIPFMSLLVAILLHEAWYLLLSLLKARGSQLARLAGVVMVMVLLTFPFLSAVKRISAEDLVRVEWDTSRVDPFRVDGAFMRLLHRQEPEWKSYSIFKSIPSDSVQYDQLKFYKRSLQIEDHYVTPVIYDLKQVSPGDTLLCCEPVLLDSLTKHYNLRTLRAWQSCTLYEIGNPKQGE